MKEIIDKQALEIGRLKRDTHEKVNSNTSKTWKTKSESELMLTDSEPFITLSDSEQEEVMVVEE